MQSNVIFKQKPCTIHALGKDLKYFIKLLFGKKFCSIGPSFSTAQWSSSFLESWNEVMSALGVVAGVEAAAVQLQKLVDGLWAEKSSKKKLDRSLRKNYS